MKRRVLLSGAVAGLGSLAGCQGILGEPIAGGRRTYGVPERTATGDETDRPIGVRVGTDPAPSSLRRAMRTELGPTRRLVLTDWGSELPDGLAVTGGFLETMTRRSPARVWLALANEREEPARVRFDGTPPFGDHVSRTDFSTGPSPAVEELALVPADDRPNVGIVPVSPAETGGCWGGERPGQETVTPEPVTVTLAPGEAAVGEYHLLRLNADSACLPDRGGFVFESDRPALGIRVGVWDPAGATPGDSRFDRRVPDLPTPETTAWFHEATAETPVFVRPSRERLVGPRAETTLELRNRSTGVVRANAGDWHLYKRHGGEWKSIAPWIDLSASRRLGPAGRATVSLTVDADRSAPTVSAADRPIGGLGPGLYAVAFGRGRAPPPASSPVRIGGGAGGERGEERRYAALFEREADPPTLTGWNVQQAWRHDGDVTLQVGASASLDAPALVVRHEPSPPDSPVELIVEQVYQAPLLRNALVALRTVDAVDQVRARSDQFSPGAAIDRFGTDRPRAWMPFRFRDENYVAALQH